jgi:deoxyribodipyrimidine photo-lyase
MQRDPLPAPQAMRPAQLKSGQALDHGQALRPAELIPQPSTIEAAQHGGSAAGLAMLESFLGQRGKNYQTAMSSPVTAATECSRISPYLSYGVLSLRRVHHAVTAEQLKLKGQRGEEASAWRKSYASFAKRLRWHCHFMQKLEDEPAIEFHNIHRGFDGLRENNFNEDFFAAWRRGETGYPLVDACMRCVAQTGWLTFRMRAMVVSFASYHLWLHWRRPARWLAKHFLDYEPGIHYSQFQMQSGVTGINTLRIYAPTKQLKDHDPTGIFVKKWVPELADLPPELLAEPWLMPPLLQQMYGLHIGTTYPEPIVDHATASKAARDKIWERRKDPAIKAMSNKVLIKHGSRRSPRR